MWNLKKRDNILVICSHNNQQLINNLSIKRYTHTYTHARQENKQRSIRIIDEMLCASKFGKLSSGHRPGKGQFSFQSQRKAMPKNAQTTPQFH